MLLAGGGTVNTVARSLGVRGRPDHVLERLMDPTARPREDPRPLLRIRTGDDAPRYGIIFVSGAGPRFLEFYYAESSRGVLGAAYSVAASLASIATAGPLGRKLFAPFDAQVEVDGERLPLERFTVMLASSIRDIGLGFRPFRTAGERIDRLHWIASDMGGVELGLRLLPLRLGVPDALGPVPQGPARCLTIHTPEPMPFTIDAELFPGGHTLSVEVGPLIRFLVV